MTAEWEIWFIGLSYFLLGSLWAFIIVHTLDTELFVPSVFVGLATAALGISIGRSARVIQAWRLRRDEAALGPAATTILMVVVTIALAVILFLLVTQYFG